MPVRFVKFDQILKEILSEFALYRRTHLSLLIHAYISELAKLLIRYSYLFPLQQSIHCGVMISRFSNLSNPRFLHFYARKFPSNISLHIFFYLVVTC